MSESKYGRLFTERDVERIIAEALIRQHTQEKVRLAGMLEHLRPEELTFPADEPLFLLRGQDRLAADAVSRYVQGCLFYLDRVGPPVTVEHVGSASEAYQAMVRWQAANPDRVKVPD